MTRGYFQLYNDNLQRLQKLKLSAGRFIFMFFMWACFGSKRVNVLHILLKKYSRFD